MTTNPTLTRDDIPDSALSHFRLADGSCVTVRVEPDESMGAPWDEHDGHGIVSEWTSRAKLPGEMVLASDRTSRRYYDFAGSLLIARRDGWGSPEGGRTPREKAALATLADFRRLRAWCNDEWSWIGVVVEIERPDGSRESDSLWGIESDGEYWRDVAAELVAMLFAPKLRRFATATRRRVHWSNMLDGYAGQYGAWTFASAAAARAFAAYASQDPPPSLAPDDLAAAGIELPVSCDDGFSIALPGTPFHKEARS